MVEAAGRPADTPSLAYLGDARFNMGNSLLTMGAMMGMDVRMVSPREFAPDPRRIDAAREIAVSTGAKITVTDESPRVFTGADFVHTDVWVSMGEPNGVWAERYRVLAPYRVTAVMALAGPQAKFMHCLPAFHDLQTSTARLVHDLTGMRELEVTDEVFHPDASIVFEQAENRLHTIKAVMVATAS